MNACLLSILCAVAMLLGNSLAAPPSKQELTKIYMEGVELMKKEQWAAADAKFVEILKHVPNHAPSLKNRAKLRIERRKSASVPSMYKSLSSLTLDKVNLDEATLEEALEFVTIRSKQLSNNKIVPNFVLRPGDGDKDFGDRKISLNMNKLPMSALLDQIGKAARTKFVFEKYAIIATPTADPNGSGVVVDADRKTAPRVRGR